VTTGSRGGLAAEDPQIPAADPGSLADVLPSAAGLLGVTLPGHAASVLDGGPAEAVTVLLVDGLGWWPWQQQADFTPTLRAMDQGRLVTTVPSTTPTALASLGTGLAPGGHGIIGAAFRLPEDGRVLHPLTWRGDPHPQAVQPEATVFEQVLAAGQPVTRIGARDYSDSGLTRAVLRGGDYIGADTPDEIVQAIASHRRGLAYAYLPDLDRVGHVYGVDSTQWRDCLRGIDTMVERILAAIDKGHRLVVTADHGMVDCHPHSKVVMESLPLFDAVVTVAGEPRLRHVYVREGMAGAVRGAWLDHLGDRAWVLDRDEMLAAGLMGEMDPDLADRVGDIVIIARDDTVLASEVDTVVSSLIGQHGSVTEAEMHIPLLQGRGHGRG
jgi:hypothetical protein